MEAQIRKKKIRRDDMTTNTDSDIFSYNDKNVETVIESTGLPSDAIKKWLFLQGLTQRVVLLLMEGH